MSGLFITGFSSFQATTDNPSAHLAINSEFPFAVLEVAFAAVDELFTSRKLEPYDSILHIGYSGRKLLTPERVAKNKIGASPDVRNESREGPIITDGLEILRNTFWSNETEFPKESLVHWSEDAGNYLCNYLFYKSLMLYPNKRVGFLHVPSFAIIAEDIQNELLKGLIRKHFSED